MFALVLYDERLRRVVLCRDYLGEKPLYYLLDHWRCLVASEIKCFHALSDVYLNVDPEALRSFFALGYLPGPHTIYREIRKLPPGHCLELDLDEWKSRQYAYRSLLDTFDSRRLASLEDLDASLSESVRHQLVADVEVGVLVSGGIDSTLISSYATAAASERPKAFCVRFGRADLDESPYARSVARALAMPLIEITGDDLDRETFERVVFHADEPLGDPACVLTFQIAKVLSGHVKVVLSGEGADELFWGYPHYQREAFVHPLERLWPRGLRHWLEVFGPRFETNPRFPPALSRLQRVLTHSHLELGTARWTIVFGDGSLRCLLPWVGAEGAGRARHTKQLAAFRAELASRTDPLTACCALDLAFWLPDDLLTKLDRMTMAHSVEARAPFLDPSVVEIALSLAPGQKATLFETKKPLRELLRRKLPSSVADPLSRRRKHGFEAPIARWLSVDLRDIAEECFAPSALASVPWIDGAYAGELWQSFLRHGGHKPFARKLWLLLCFLMWLRQHERAFGFRPPHTR